MVAVLVAADFQMMMVSLAEVLAGEVEEAGRNTGFMHFFLWDLEDSFGSMKRLLLNG